MRFPRHILQSGLLALALLSACSSTPTTHYYVLDAIKADEQPRATLAATAAIMLDVEIPHYLDRPGMVSRGQSNQLHLAEYHQWGGHLRDNIARVLADNLSTRLASAEIYIVPMPDDVKPDASLSVNIRTFERMPDGHVHLSAQWRFTARGRKTQSHFEELIGDHVVGEQGYAAMVTEMDALLARFSSQVAQTML